jgi:hypothetical protein
MPARESTWCVTVGKNNYFMLVRHFLGAVCEGASCLTEADSTCFTYVASDTHWRSSLTLPSKIWSGSS